MAEPDDTQKESNDEYEPVNEELQDEEEDTKVVQQEFDENNDEEHLESENYELPPVGPTNPANPYGSVKRPLKSVPKSEIATPSTSAQSKQANKSQDYDSCFDHSADDSGAQDSSAPTAAKKPRGHLPKQCYVCGLIVTRMRDHMKSHPNELQYKCEHCPKSYLTKTGRDRHMDGQHPEMR